MILDLSISRTMRNKCLLCRPPNQWYFVIVASTKTALYQITDQFSPFSFHSSVLCLKLPFYQFTEHAVTFVLPAFHNPCHNYLLTHFMTVISIPLSLSSLPFLPSMSLYHSSCTFLSSVFWTLSRFSSLQKLPLPPCIKTLSLPLVPSVPSYET